VVPGIEQEDSSSSMSGTESVLSNAPTDIVYECPICEIIENKQDDQPWITCDKCDRWYHIYCVDIDADVNLSKLRWIVHNFKFLH